MYKNLRPLFDFSAHLPARDEILPLIKEFAAYDDFRSADVAELELDEDFYRRPLRPEDLEFLLFKKAVRADTVSRLPSLATNRLLMCINELQTVRLPETGNDDEFARFQGFYGDKNQALAGRLRSYLENYAFDYLGQETAPGLAVSHYQEQLLNLVAAERDFWKDMFATLVGNNYLQEGLRFILIQRWSLAESKSISFRRAVANGYMEAFATQDWPRPGQHGHVEGLLKTMAEMCGVNRRSHSYWQFYLPTSLAKCNFLAALAARPDRVFALCGAAFAEEAESLAFNFAVEEACPHIPRRPGMEPVSLDSAVTDLTARFGRIAEAAMKRFGQRGVDAIGQGLAARQKLAERARWDLGEQLKWLSAIDVYCSLAQKVDKRIQKECPNIDRETFVEPREMCSTTHVHNDHRLVVIESGDMIFWGNAGMQLQMTVGDMVLIPDGRLHGSTVVSAECTYHQPIISDEWITALLAEHAAQAPAATSRTAEAVLAQN